MFLSVEINSFVQSLIEKKDLRSANNRETRSTIEKSGNSLFTKPVLQLQKELNYTRPRNNNTVTEEKLSTYYLIGKMERRENANKLREKGRLIVSKKERNYYYGVGALLYVRSYIQRGN